MSLKSMPLELLHTIATFLPPANVLSLACTSRWYEARLHNYLGLLARDHRLPIRSTLTNGMYKVTFWYERPKTTTVLEWAIMTGRRCIFNRLIELHGIDLVQADCWGVTLLHRLSAQGLADYLGPIIQRLREHHISPHQFDASRLTPLHYAAGLGMVDAVRLLLSLGADASAVDYHGNTPLHLAAVTGSWGVFEHLVRAGGELRAMTRYGWTAIDQASITHQGAAVEKLISLGSPLPAWEEKPYALEEFGRLSPCPLECYRYHTNV